jgi:hypothetical protein
MSWLSQFLGSDLDQQDGDEVDGDVGGREADVAAHGRHEG